MPMREDLPITLTPADEIRRSIGTISALAALGLAASLGLYFAVIFSGSAPRFAEAPARAQIEPLQIMTNSKDLPAAHHDDYSFVFN